MSDWMAWTLMIGGLVICSALAIRFGSGHDGGDASLRGGRRAHHERAVVEQHAQNTKQQFEGW